MRGSVVKLLRKIHFIDLKIEAKKGKFDLTFKQTKNWFNSLPHKSRRDYNNWYTRVWFKNEYSKL